MIYRPYDEHAIYGPFAKYGEWKAGVAEVHQAAADAVGRGEKPSFHSHIYGRLKEFQLGWFQGKCAYCETPIDPGFWGDVEHYRPKRRVEEDPTHPGYYWLAYEPSNLLPSCQRCNQGEGKKSRFPVRAGTRAFDNAGLANEIPLLLSPYLHRPVEHLAYDFEGDAPTGNMKALSEEGAISIGVYRLNRKALVEQRLDVQIATVDGYRMAGKQGKRDAFIDRINRGHLSYLAARMAALSVVQTSGG